MLLGLIEPDKVMIMMMLLMLLMKTTKTWFAALWFERTSSMVPTDSISCFAFVIVFIITITIAIALIIIMITAHIPCCIAMVFTQEVEVPHQH